MHTKSSPKTDRFSAVYGLLLYYVLLLIYLFGFFRFRIFFLIEYEQLAEYIVADDDQNCGDQGCHQQIYTDCGQYLHHYHIQDQRGYSGNVRISVLRQHRAAS